MIVRAASDIFRAAVVPGTPIMVRQGTCREALVIDRVVEIVGEGDRARIVVEATDSTGTRVCLVFGPVLVHRH